MGLILLHGFCIYHAGQNPSIQFNFIYRFGILYTCDKLFIWHLLYAIFLCRFAFNARRFMFQKSNDILPKLSDCRGCRRYKEDVVSL